METIEIKEQYLPTVLQSLKFLLVLTFVVETPIFLLFGAIGESSGLSLYNPIIGIFTEVLAFLLLYEWMKRKYQFSLREMFSLKGNRINQFIAAGIIIIGSSIVLSELMNYVMVLLPVDDNWVYQFEIMSGLHFNPIVAFLSVVIIAPIYEEVIFRRLILRGYLKHYSPVAAILLSAFIFGAIHMNMWQFVYGFLAGLIFGYIYYRTGSLVLCIFAHALNNGIDKIAMVLNIQVEGYTVASQTVSHQPVWFTAIGVFMLVVGIFYFNRATCRNFNNSIESDA